jgi:hypothetical protein
MNCGNQSAHISMIHRRFKPSRRVTLALSILQTFSIEAQKAVKFMRTLLTTVRPYQLAVCGLRAPEIAERRAAMKNGYQRLRNPSPG